MMMVTTLNNKGVNTFFFPSHISIFFRVVNKKMFIIYIFNKEADLAVVYNSSKQILINLTICSYEFIIMCV
jgi:hypothetical protein